MVMMTTGVVLIVEVITDYVTELLPLAHLSS
jgi:hypothetical protein